MNQKISESKNFQDKSGKIHILKLFCKCFEKIVFYLINICSVQGTPTSRMGDSAKTPEILRDFAPPAIVKRIYPSARFVHLITFNCDYLSQDLFYNLLFQVSQSRFIYFITCSRITARLLSNYNLKILIIRRNVTFHLK